MATPDMDPVPTGCLSATACDHRGEIERAQKGNQIVDAGPCHSERSCRAPGVDAPPTTNLKCTSRSASECDANYVPPTNTPAYRVIFPNGTVLTILLHGTTLINGVPLPPGISPPTGTWG